AGKSTLLSLIGGINKPYSGRIKTSCKISALPQNPQSLFLKNTVLEDLREVFDGSGIQKEEVERRISKIVRLCRLDGLLSRHPFDLSGGEQQRAALAKVLLLDPGVVLLDEPTKGFDAEFKLVFAGIIRRLTSSGTTVIMVSHDVEFCAAHAHKCVMLFNGDAVSAGTAREFFASNSFYTTSASRMTKGIIDGAVTAEDVIYCCNAVLPDDNLPDNDDEDDFLQSSVKDKTAKKHSASTDNKLSAYKRIIGIISLAMLISGIFINLDLFGLFDISGVSFQLNILLIALPLCLMMVSFGSFTKKEINSRVSSDKRLRKRTIFAAVLIVFAIPLTIFFGIAFLNDEKYLFISLLVMLEAMLPFFLIFEGRKPQARELVILAVLCAVAVSGRAVFYMLPMFKPVLAVVIITGVALGAESGFIVGAVTMLVSNMLFGQGPWTPWQMFAAGIIGFVSGILFKKGLLGRSRGAMCAFGFIVTLIIYGPIMNFASFIMSRSLWNAEIIASFFIQGFPMDLIHAFSTLVFLFFAAEPMLEKLDRVKVKYGLYI
ncbi:MAG: ATP-binding cassette domain-containing protein, partial [Ruminococcus sp.]|nr:ATP-binding cassette domain-containing protein [Ruminococcus sp.]